MGRRTAVLAALIAIAVLGGGAVLAYRARGGGEDARLRAFFAVPTPRSCGTAALTVTAGQGRFAAFIPGHEDVTSVRGRFLIVPYAVAPAGPAAAQHFVLAAPDGARYQPLQASATGQNGRTELVFDIPSSLSAAKLIFDDGCTHQEWLAP